MFNTDKKNKPVNIPTREVTKTEIKTENKPAVPPSDTMSIISQGIKIKGEINGNSNLDIHGKFEGSINLENNNINIENTAQIKADICTKTIKVNGKIIGNISANEKILVTNNGSITGDINAPKIEIQEGANFDGNISMKKVVKKIT